MKSEPICNLLDTVNYPDDLRRLDIEQLPEVCSELRQGIIKELCYNPRHFTASLGTVELTVALHYTYNTPYNRVVWDVGHQAHGHKIPTGHHEAFSANRKLRGIRPFPSPEGSGCDTFTCGHTSDSTSAALGMAIAATREGDVKRHVVAIIDDGSTSGGLAFEGLNDAFATSNNLLITLNDSDMAIDRSVRGMKQCLFNLAASNHYNQLRFRFPYMLFKLGILDEEHRKALIRFGNSLKSMATQQQNIFEGMNIRYFGPVDGHGVKNPARVLRGVKDMQGPKILYLRTIKGRGFDPAEKHAIRWHVPGKFDPVTGEHFIVSTRGIPPLFQDVFGNTLVELTEASPKIVGIAPAMPSGCSMNILMEKMPRRTFDVGIAEGRAAIFSGGMTEDGLQPPCSIYPFLIQRTCDNIIHDVAIQNLPTVSCLDRTGLVGKDDPTHRGALDMTYLRPIPNLTINSPMDEHELRRLMYTTQLPDKGPFVIRYPRGRGILMDWKCSLEEVPVGKGWKLKEGSDFTVIIIGPIGNVAARTITRAKADFGLSIAHYDLRFLKPLDEELLREVGRKFQRVLTIEDGIIKGSMGGTILKFMADNEYKPTVKRTGVPNLSVEYGSIAELHQLCGMSEEGILTRIKEFIS